MHLARDLVMRPARSDGPNAYDNHSIYSCGVGCGLRALGVWAARVGGVGHALATKPLPRSPAACIAKSTTRDSLRGRSCKLQATSYKLQATSHKPQATSHKPQATSYKLLATSASGEGHHHAAHELAPARVRLAGKLLPPAACRVPLVACRLSLVTGDW